MPYGWTPETYEAAVAEMRDLCIAVARSGTTITYGELAAQMTTVSVHPGAYGFHALLRTMCYAEDDAGRGMLCAVVVRQSSGRPGGGFFKAMIRRGRDCGDPEACWQAEIARLTDYWQTHEDD